MRTPPRTSRRRSFHSLSVKRHLFAGGRYYSLKDVDIDLWEFDGKHGISLVERSTSCFCIHTGVERDYVFADEPDRARFCCLIYAVHSGVLPPGAVDGVVQREAAAAASARPFNLFVSTWNQVGRPSRVPVILPTASQAPVCIFTGRCGAGVQSGKGLDPDGWERGYVCHRHAGLSLSLSRSLSLFRARASPP